MVEFGQVKALIIHRLLGSYCKFSGFIITTAKRVQRMAKPQQSALG
jgi:hypothetical protein